MSFLMGEMQSRYEWLDIRVLLWNGLNSPLYVLWLISAETRPRNCTNYHTSNQLLRDHLKVTPDLKSFSRLNLIISGDPVLMNPSLSPFVCVVDVKLWCFLER